MSQGPHNTAPQNMTTISSSQIPKSTLQFPKPKNFASPQNPKPNSQIFTTIKSTTITPTKSVWTMNNFQNYHKPNSQILNTKTHEPNNNMFFCYKIKEKKNQEKRSVRRRLYLNYFSMWSSTHISIWYIMNQQQFSSMLLFIELGSRNKYVNLIRKWACKLNEEVSLWLFPGAVLKSRIKCSVK